MERIHLFAYSLTHFNLGIIEAINIDDWIKRYYSIIELLASSERE